jgi:hypothetical protein
MEYRYDSEEYVWPQCVKVHQQCRPWETMPGREHLLVIEALLTGFSGICNANYKLKRSRGGPPALRLLEINPRVGADLGHDVPREEAARLITTYSRLEALACGRELAKEGDSRRGRPTPLLEPACNTSQL